MSHSWDAIAGCGWGFDCSVDVVALAGAKLRKLRQQLFDLMQAKKVSRQQLLQWLGLLAWAVSIGP